MRLRLNLCRCLVFLSVLGVLLLAAPANATISGRRVTVASTATLIGTAYASDSVHMTIVNRGANAVYLGAATVTTSTGFQLDPGGSVNIVLRQQPETIYGIVASSTETVHVLESLQ